MRLILARISILLLLSFVNSCHSTREDYSKYLKITEEEWLVVMEEIGGNLDQLDNTILLITYYTSCGACLSELKNWNNQLKELNKQGILVKLILVDRHIERLGFFKKQNNFAFNMYHDQNALIAEKNLIPALPVKVLFDETGDVKKIQHIGKGETVEEFVK